MKILIKVVCLALLVSHAYSASLTRTKKGRAQKDLGNILLQVDLQENGNGRIDWGGGNLRGGWWNTQWKVGNRQIFLKCGKHFVAGSRGYPKTLSRVAGNKGLRYNSKRKPGFRFRGRWQSGAYVWLDNNRSGLGTHEINIWNHSFSTSRPYTFFGNWSDDGSNYKIYRFQNSGFKSWVVVRQRKKLSMNTKWVRLANVIRNRHKMPNHEVINVLLAKEGHNRGSEGSLQNTRFGVSDL